MIVVGILAPGARGADSATAIARAAAGAGARTELVGVVPPGRDGDRQLARLAAADVGHATVTRSAAAGLEPADLDLALRYLPDVRAIVMVATTADLLATAASAAAWSGATLLVVGPLDAEAMAVVTAAGAGPPDGSSVPIVLEPPSRDPDAAFAGLVAALAVRLDAGEDPARAWQSTIATLAIDPA